MEDIERIKAARRARTSQEIADALKKSGMSHKEFALKMKRMPSEVTKWLSGNHNFTTNLLAEISVVLGEPISGAVDELAYAQNRLASSQSTSSPQNGSTSSSSAPSAVDGYGKSEISELHDSDTCCLYDVEIPFDVADALRQKAETKGLTFRQFVRNILSEKAKEKPVKISDFSGSIDENFPSAEEIRSLRTVNSRVER